MSKDKEHKKRIYERVEKLINGEVDDPDSETPPTKEQLTEKLSELIWDAAEVSFRMKLIMSDLQLEDSLPPCVDDFEWSMDDLKLPTV